MKKLMMVVIAMLVLASCGEKKQTAKNADEQSCKEEACAGCPSACKDELVISGTELDTMDKVMVYYYHGERKCATCKAVGAVALETVGNEFPNNEGIKFIELDISKEDNKSFAEKNQLTGSGLIVCKGDSMTDLTTFAFLKAVHEPEALQQKLKETIKGYTN